MKPIKLNNKQQVMVRKLNDADHSNLFVYLQNLSFDSKKRFGPHPFTKEAIDGFYQEETRIGYLALETEASTIVGYAIIKKGYLEQDRSRLQLYGFIPDENTDVTYAPSVADAWQSCGLGNAMFHFILADIAATETKRIILWGGVQATNTKAVNFYTKNGFKKLGEFSDHNGLNYDMALY